MKKIRLILFQISVIVTFLGFGVNSLANTYGVPVIAGKTVSEPITILFVGFGLIALSSFLRRGSRHDE
jgi:thiamine monophosphate kinase